jgi:hypothetical protein
MKTKLLITALLGLFIASLASAASLTVATALELRAGLQALDGQTQIVKVKDRDGVLADSVVVVPYKFTGDTRWKIAGALTIIKPFLDTFDTAKASLIKATGVDVDPKNDAKLAAFNTEINKDLARKSDDLKLPTLTRADLNLADNPIPGSVLSALQSIIKFD